MNAKTLTLAVLGGLLVGGLAGFLRPYWAPLTSAPEEAPEYADLRSYVVAHPLQGACDRSAGFEFGVSLYWSLPADVTVNRLMRSTDGAAAVPVFTGSTDAAAALTEFRDTNVTIDTLYTYHVETDGGVSSNMLPIRIGATACPER